MSQGIWVLLVVLASATAFGLWRAARDGRFRGTHPLADHGRAAAARAAGEPSPADPGRSQAGPGLDLGPELTSSLGERATLLQFSSAFCAPCRVTRRVLGEVAGLVPGVAHLEVDAEAHLDLVRRLGITRTPTTLLLDAAGREVSRASGAPTKETVLATLGRALPV